MKSESAPSILTYKVSFFEYARRKLVVIGVFTAAVAFSYSLLLYFTVGREIEYKLSLSIEPTVADLYDQKSLNAAIGQMFTHKAFAEVFATTLIQEISKKNNPNTVGMLDSELRRVFDASNLLTENYQVDRMMTDYTMDFMGEFSKKGRQLPRRGFAIYFDVSPAKRLEITIRCQEGGLGRALAENLPTAYKSAVNSVTSSDWVGQDNIEKKIDFITSGRIKLYKPFQYRYKFIEKEVNQLQSKYFELMLDLESKRGLQKLQIQGVDGELAYFSVGYQVNMTAILEREFFNLRMAPLREILVSLIRSKKLTENELVMLSERISNFEIAKKKTYEGIMSLKDYSFQIEKMFSRIASSSLSDGELGYLVPPRLNENIQVSQVADPSNGNSKSFVMWVFVGAVLGFGFSLTCLYGVWFWKSRHQRPPVNEQI